MERAYHAMLSMGVHHRQRPTVGIDGQVWKLRPLRVVPDVYALAAERPRRVGDVRDDATRAGVGDEVVRLGGPRGGAPVESALLAAAFLVMLLMLMWLLVVPTTRLVVPAAVAAVTLFRQSLLKLGAW